MSLHTSRTAAKPQPAVVARMADFLRSRTASAGAITREDLLLDFSGEEIDSHFEQAKAKARADGRGRR